MSAAQVAVILLVGGASFFVGLVIQDLCDLHRETFWSGESAAGPPRITVKHEARRGKTEALLDVPGERPQT